MTNFLKYNEKSQGGDRLDSVVNYVIGDNERKIEEAKREHFINMENMRAQFRKQNKEGFTKETNEKNIESISKEESVSENEETSGEIINQPITCKTEINSGIIIVCIFIILLIIAGVCLLTYNIVNKIRESFVCNHNRFL